MSNLKERLAQRYRHALLATLRSLPKDLPIDEKRAALRHTLSGLIAHDKKRLRREAGWEIEKLETHRLNHFRKRLEARDLTLLNAVRELLRK